MTAQDNSGEEKRRFLEEIATQYNFFGDTREAFLNRFDESKARQKNTDLANSINWTGQPEDKAQKLQDELDNICKVLEKNGCLIVRKSSNEKKQGRSPKGQSPWEQAFKWLWQTKFPNCQKKPSSENINWREICNQVLATQHLRRQATAQQYELNIYVPLGLMERPKTPNPRINATGEDSPPQKEPEWQIGQTYKDDAFFQKVIAENHTEKGKHIAIIGEPGAGKTTLLGDLAERLAKKSPDFPICIRLADLRSSTIADYLLNNWLSKALQFIDFDAENVTPEIRKSFKQLFAAGKVWLLLDGVDEMAASSPIEALARIREQLTDWVGKARVVLTCRFNVWDAAISNPLTDFDTYKTLQFEPDDVDKFIRQWFEKASEDTKRRNSGNETFWREQGKRLTRQLKEPGKDNIRKMVRNPLRLSMLCQSWCVPEPELPETKAALYEQFITYFFEWKQEEFSKKQRVLNHRDKKQIQQALAKLALAAMESVNRFRIEQDFAIEQMEEVWFNLADELGWLVLVDRDTRTKKPVYAFFHPTFQEYFAACAIGDWHFFLNHVPQNPKQGIYRIFEKQWKEVILLWLGRQEEWLRKEKEKFIKALIEFDDGCNSFYSFQAFFLAALGIAEFKNCIFEDAIVQQMFFWGFAYFNPEQQQWRTFFKPIAEKARESLSVINCASVINKLIDILEFTQNDENRRLAAVTLEKLAVKSERAITVLLRIIETSEGTFSESLGAIVYCFGQIGTNNKWAIAQLFRILETTNNDYVRWLVGISLGYIAKSNKWVIEQLIRILETSEDTSFRWIVALSLSRLDPGNKRAIARLAHILETTDNEEVCRSTAYSLGQIDPGNRQSIATLLHLLQITVNEEIQRNIIHNFGQVAIKNRQVIDFLVHILETTENQSILIQVAITLKHIAVSDEQAIAALEQILETNETDYVCGFAADILGEINPGNKQVIPKLLFILENSINEDTRSRAIYSLGQFAVGYEMIIRKLVYIIEITESEDVRRSAIHSLGKIARGNEQVIDTLVRLLESSQNQFTYWSLIETLGEIAVGNQQVITVLMRIMKTTEDEQALMRTYSSLSKIIQYDNLPPVISDLKKSVTSPKYENNSYLYEKCFGILWQCSYLLPYPAFYQMWNETNIPAEAQEVIDVNNVCSTQIINLANLPQDLAEVINNQPELCSKVKLICIDTHQFIDPENPAPEIYDEMLNQKCPEWQNGYPETMQKLKLYWNYLRRISEIPLFLICYDSTALTATPTEFSLPFLTALSKFEGAICVVWETGEIGLQTFSPSQPDLVSNIVKWIETKILET